MEHRCWTVGGRHCKQLRGRITEENRADITCTRRTRSRRQSEEDDTAKDGVQCAKRTNVRTDGRTDGRARVNARVPTVRRAGSAADWEDAVCRCSAMVRSRTLGGPLVVPSAPHRTAEPLLDGRDKAAARAASHFLTLRLAGSPLSFFRSLSARARALATVRTPLHDALKFDSPRECTARSPANSERMFVCMYVCAQRREAGGFTAYTNASLPRSRLHFDRGGRCKPRLHRRRLLWNLAHDRQKQSWQAKRREATAGMEAQFLLENRITWY